MFKLSLLFNCSFFWYFSGVSLSVGWGFLISCCSVRNSVTVLSGQNNTTGLRPCRRPVRKLTSTCLAWSIFLAYQPCSMNSSTLKSYLRQTLTLHGHSDIFSICSQLHITFLKLGHLSHTFLINIVYFSCISLLLLCV